MKAGGRQVQLYNSDIADWSISFVDTGLHANIGQRLKAVERHLAGEEMFMDNYADGLADLDLNHYVNTFMAQDKIASFLCVQPSQSFHVVSVAPDWLVSRIQPARQADIWINGGFFIFKHKIFDYLQNGEELVAEPFQRLITEGQLLGHRSLGFWACMDTLKEKNLFDEMYTRGERPWAVWEPGSPPVTAPSPLAAPAFPLPRPVVKAS
jgi:glucose-1-phosphate cytidylyltransferase